ncbi:MAG: hypothetical protein GEU88_19620, partial [Solirubrobacterales bacterium]|nr:hypothetical protein [Solirubrobacterales bacterium]
MAARAHAALRTALRVGSSRWLAVLAAGLVAGLALVAVSMVAPAPAHAIRIPVVSDVVDAGLGALGDAAAGIFDLTVGNLAKLLVSLVEALVGLIIPRQLVEAGVDGAKWLVQFPAFGEHEGGPVGGWEAGAGHTPTIMQYPNLGELRSMLTWIGLSLLPLGLIHAGARAMLAPSVNQESLHEVMARTVVAGCVLILYDWGWDALSELSNAVTEAILSPPWVADGLESMMELMTVGAATASVTLVSSFVVIVALLLCGLALLGLVLFKIGLLVGLALTYVTGGLVFGLAPSPFGRRLVSGWLTAVGILVVVPVLWAIVFATGSALMLDVSEIGEGEGFGAFIDQMFLLGASFATFYICIKLGKMAFSLGTGAFATLGAAGGAAGGGGGGGGGSGGAALAGRVDSARARLSSFGSQVRPGVRGAAAAAGGATGRAVAAVAGGMKGGVGAGSYPLRHPMRTGQAVRAGAAGAGQMTARD